MVREIERELSKFIVDNFLFGDTSATPVSDAPLVASGLVDSTGILEIVAFLESKYDVHPTDEELVVENFGSISTIAKFVASKRA